MNLLPFENTIKNFKYYLDHSFSLTDLTALIPSYQSFRKKTPQIEINADQNFTFETLEYSFSLYRRQENQLRILYYAFLTSIFQTKNAQLKDKNLQNLLKIVIQNFNVILPFKKTVKNELKNPSIIMTTNQLKSSFVKFMSRLMSSQHKTQIVLSQIISLPQIDFVLMSIFQMYFTKNQQTLHDKLEKIGKDFGLQTQVSRNCFQIEDFEFEVKNSDQDDWQTIFVRKIQQKNKFKKQLKLKKQDTIESIGEIEHNQLYTTQEEVNQGLNCQQLINAKFVESCSSQTFFNLQSEGINQQNIEISQAPQIVVNSKPSQVTNHSGPDVKTKLKEKKTTFLNESSSNFFFSKSTRIQKKMQTIKPVLLNTMKNLQDNKQNSRLWLVKSIKTEKQINFNNSVKFEKLSTKQLSTSESKGFFRFNKIRQNDSLNMKRSQTKKLLNQEPKLGKSFSSKFFFRSVRLS